MFDKHKNTNLQNLILCNIDLKNLIHNSFQNILNFPLYEIHILTGYILAAYEKHNQIGSIQSPLITNLYKYGYILRHM